MTQSLMRINGVNNNTSTEVREAQRAVIIATIKALKSGEITRPTKERKELELNSKIAQLKQMDLIPLLHEMVENDCTVKELNIKAQEMGYQKIDITLVKFNKLGHEE